MTSSTKWRGLGVLSAALLCSAGTWAAGKPPADLKALQDENQRLAAQLLEANAEIARLKGEGTTQEPKGEGATNGSRELREVNAPLLLTPEEQSNAPGSSAVASTGTKDFMLAVGSKFWVTEWNTWRAPNVGSGGAFTNGTNIQTLTSTSASELSAIPNLTLRYKSFFLTGSYLAPTRYSFPYQSQVYTGVGTSDIASLEYALEGQREEWDVSVGYQVIPYLALTAGYKEIKQEFFSSACRVTAGGLSLNCADFGGDPLRAKITYAGPTLGISGAAPIGHGLGLYGNFNYGWMGANYRDNPPVDAVSDVDYYVAEMGITYSHLMKEMPVYMPLSSATVYAGYRYQSYESQLRGASARNGNNPKDVVQGFVSGVNLAF